MIPQTACLYSVFEGVRELNPTPSAPGIKSMSGIAEALSTVAAT